MKSIHKKPLFWSSLALCIGFFAIYLNNLFPSMYGGDSGELIVSSHILGIPHAPGYPLFSLLGKLFEILVPWGNPAFTINLSAAVLGAVSLVLFFRTALILLHDKLISFITAIFLGCMPIFFEQSVVTEVFMLNICIALMIVVLAEGAYPDMRYIYAASFLFGVGLANHQTIILIIPALHCLLQPVKKKIVCAIYLTAFALVFIKVTLGIGFFMLSFIVFYMKYPIEKRLWLAGIKCIIWISAGLSLYVYLPIRALHNPAINFGDPDTIERFINVITRKEFGSFTLHPTALFKRGFVSTWGQVLGYVSTLVKHIGLTGLAVAFLGLIEAKNKKKLWFLTLFFLVPGPIFVLYSNLSPNTLALWRLERFHLLPNIAVVILIGFGIVWILARISAIVHMPARVKSLISILIIMICVYPLDRIQCSRNNFVLWDFGNNLLRTCAPHASVILDTKLFDEYGSSFAFSTVVEKKRRDLQLIARSGTMLKNIYGDDFYYLRGEERVSRIIEKEKKWLKKNSQSTYYAVMDRHVLPPGTYTYAGLLVRSGQKVFDYNPFYIKRWQMDAEAHTIDYPTGLLLVHYPYFEAKMYDENNNFQKADRLFESCMEYGRDMEWLMYNIGSLYSQRGDLVRAEKYFTRSVQLDPFFPEAYFGLGFLYYKNKQYKQAESAFNQTLALNPHFPDAYYNLGIAQWQMGKKDSAREAWQRFLAYKPNSPQAEMIKTMLKEKHL